MRCLFLRIVPLVAVLTVFFISPVWGQDRFELLFGEGMALKEEGKYPEAYGKLHLAATQAEKDGQWDRWAEARIKAGTCLGQDNRALEAIHYFEATRSALPEKFDAAIRREFQLRLDKSLAYYYRRLNAVDFAVRYQLEVLNARTEMGADSAELAQSCLNLAVTLAEKNDLVQAATYLERGLSLSKGDKPYQSRFLTTMGMLRMAAGNVPAAEKAFQRAYELRLQSIPGDHEAMGGALLFLASAALEMGQFDRAEQHLGAARTHLLQCPKCFELWGDFHSQRARLLGGKGAPAEAVSEGEQAAASFAQDPYLLRQLAVQRIENGAYHLRMDSLRAAEADFRGALEIFLPDFAQRSTPEALPELDSLQTQPWVIEALKGLGEVYRLRHVRNPENVALLESSMQCLSLAVEQASIIRRAFVSPDARLGLNNKVYALFEEAVVRALELAEVGGKEEYRRLAFSLAEQGKAAVLLEELAAADQVSGTGVPAEMRDRLSELDLSYRVYRECALSAGPDRAEACRFKSDSILRERGELLIRLRELYPSYFSARYQAQPMGIDTLQRRLGPAEALVEYFVGDSNLVIFTITRDAFEVRRMGLPAGFNDGIRALRNSIMGTSSQALNDFRLHARALYLQVAEPWATKLPAGIEAVTIIPDGLLGYLPFEVLLSEDPGEKIYPQLPYLIRRYRFSYAYSATLRYRERPSVPTGEARVLACALSFSRDQGTATRGHTERHQLSALPNAITEVEAIGKRFEGSFLLDGSATETAFREQAPGFGILHLATHTIFNDSVPDATRIVFAAEEGENDGYLHAYELYGLNLRADLAVLSACQTGDGELLRGEGVMSLGRAFTYAGCRSTVITLWPLNDQASGRIMADFYRHLSRGMGKDEALHRAKLEYLEAQDGPRANPFYWAAFILSGEVSPVAPASGSLAVYWFAPIGGVPVILLLVLLFVRRRARKSKGVRLKG